MLTSSKNKISKQAEKRKERTKEKIVVSATHIIFESVQKQVTLC